jgi:Raf kinase inhibitor-like YbhB/YbcL family protein
MRAWPNLASLLVLTSIISVAQHSGSPAKGGPAMAFTLTTSAFAPGAEIPNQYTCKGEDISPALRWSGAPAKTASYAIIMDDPDAPAGVWVHWVLWNVAPSTTSLPEGVPKNGQLDDGSQHGRNSFGKIGYNGPCPPPGQTHRYFFRLYALDTKLNLSADADRSQLDAAMKGHVLAQTEYMGSFHR